MRNNNIKEEKLNFFSKWAKFFITKYKLTIILLIALVILGLFGASNNQRQDFPSIPINYIFVSATYPGASPEVIGSDVIKPIENQIKGHKEVAKMRSSAYANYGSVVIETKSFDKETINKTITEFNELANKASLPDGVDINVGTEDAAGPSLVYVLSSDKISYNEIIKKAPKVKEYLEKESKEIKEVQVMPETDFDVKIKLDAKALQEKRLDVNTVKQIIQANLQVLPGGSITDEETNISKQITINNPVSQIDDIKNITLADGSKLSEIAEITEEAKSGDTQLAAGFLRDGQPQYSDQAVYLMLIKQDKGDVIKMKKDITAAIDKIYDKNILDENINIDLTYDSSTYVETQISTLLRNGIFGLIIILVVFMFFIDIRAGLVVSLIVPFSFLITLFILYELGFTINILTTFAMILTLGIIVDNAIVIAEGMQHRMSKYGDSKLKAALSTIRDLGPAVTSATATTVVVFIPAARMGGIIGEFMKYIPYTMIIMLVVSYFLAISITPLLGKWILKKETEEERKERRLTKSQKYLVLPAIVFYGQKMIDKLVEVYGRFMSRVYRKWTYKLAIVLILLAGFIYSMSLVGTGKVKSSQFPMTDTQQFSISMDFPVGTSNEVKKEITSDLMKEAIKVPYFEGSFMMQGQLFILITDPSKRRNDKDTTVYTIVDNLNEKINYIRDRAPQDTTISVGAQGYGPTSSSYDVIVEVKNTDGEAIKKTIEGLDSFVVGKEDNGDFKINKISNELKDNLVPSIEINFDKNKIEEYGIAPLTTSMIVNSVFSESDLGKVTIGEGGRQDGVKLLFNENSKKSIDDIKNLIVGVQGIKPIKLSDIAEVKSEDKAQSINFIDGARSVSYQIYLDVADEDKAAEITKVQKDIQDYLNKDRLNDFGLDEDSIAYGGFASDIATDFNKLLVTFIIAIIAVFLILAYQFNSYLQPLMIMLAVPVALIGVFPALYAVGSSLDMISGLGVITLVGIVVNDAIVFIDYFNRLRKRDKNQKLSEALVETGKMRFKPIFSTSITTIAAIVPLTIQDPFWRGLGTTVIFGLTFATIGNLIVLPIVINMVERIFGWFRGRFGRKVVG